MLVFFDDVLIYSQSMEQNISHLHQILMLLRQHKIFLNKTNYTFAQDKVEYLGHIISSESISTDPIKIDIIED